MLKAYQQQNHHLASLPFDEINKDLVLWIDLFSPTEEEERRVEEAFQLQIPTREETKEIETTSRLYEENDAHYMTITLLASALYPEKTQINITFILKKNVLICLRYDEPSTIRSFASWITNKPSIPVDNTPSLLLGFLEKCVGRIADILESFSLKIEELSQAIFINQKKHQFESHLVIIGKYEQGISSAKESLKSLSLLFRYLRQTQLVSGADLDERMHNLQLDATALNEHTQFFEHKISFLLDATFGFIDIEQTKIIKIFSVAAVMFLPPTLVASVYGMNFKKIPELDWSFGYPFALCLIILSALFPYLYFRNKGWL